MPADASHLPMMPARRVPPSETLAVCLLALVPILVKLLCYPTYPGSDDAFIHLTIVRNLTHGLGWGINPHEPTNLSSSPLYTTLLTLLNLGGCPALAAGEGLSALAGFGAIVLLHRLLVTLGLRPVSCLAGAAVAAFNIYLWRWDGIVMETSLGLLLLTLACLAYHRAVNQPAAWRYLLTGGAVGLATLTRFELALAVGCFGLREIAVHGTAVARWLRSCVAMSLGFLVVVAPWFVFCQAYFHLLLPTTFYAKTSHGLLWWNPVVATELFKVTASSEVIPLLGVLLLLAVAWRHRRAGAVAPGLVNGLDLFLFPLLLTLFYYLKTPTLESAARYYLPALHLLAAALACLLDALAEGVPAASLRPVVAAVVAAHAVLALGFNQLRVAPILSRFKENYWSTAQNAAEVLRSRAPAGGKLKVLVEVDIGMLSYYAGDRCYFFDGGALATPSLRGLTLARQVVQTHPDVVIETLGDSVGAMSAKVPGLVEVWHRPFHSHSLTYPTTVYVCNIYENRS